MRKEKARVEQKEKVRVEQKCWELVCGEELILGVAVGRQEETGRAEEIDRCCVCGRVGVCLKKRANKIICSTPHKTVAMQ